MKETISDAGSSWICLLAYFVPAVLEVLIFSNCKDQLEHLLISAKAVLNVSIDNFLDSDFPGLTMNCLSYAGPYVVFAVTNNGPRTVYSEVRRFVTISSGQHEDFTSVAIPAGETLTRVFRILDNANPLQTTLEFDIDAPVDLSPAENDIVISLLQYP